MKLFRSGLALATLIFSACQTIPPATKQAPLAPPTPALAARTDDVIIAAGQAFHTGTRVVTWMEPGGYDGYRQNPPKPGEAASENHAARRIDSPAEPGVKIETTVPLDLPALQKIVDQFVLHYDGVGLSQRCFEILQLRNLSVHFLLDVDGTIYQTLDLRERAYHATIANSRSIGIEIANIGAFPEKQSKPLAEWYSHDAHGELRLSPPPRFTHYQVRTKEFIARPARSELVRGVINRQPLQQYDFTPEQYAALSKLTAALHRVFPLIRLDYPRAASGRLVTHQLSAAEWGKFQGVIGHFHIQNNKVDPGPAFQWHRVIDGAREEAAKANLKDDAG